MGQKENTERLERVFTLLIRIAMGNFTASIERTEKTDELEALTALVNIVVEELKDSFLHQGFINTDASYMELVNMVFFLDLDGKIVLINEDVDRLLGYGKKELIQRPMGYILQKDSLPIWTDQIRNLLTNGKMKKNLKLKFMTSDGLVMSEFCKLMLLPNECHLSARIMVVTSNIIKDKATLEGKQRRKILARIDRLISNRQDTPKIKSIFNMADIEIIRNIGNYLRHHPEKDITSLKKLALEFGTNEYKLKRGFKEFFGMTVFRFLKNERLKNAHLSIRNTNEQFKNIAKMNGFRNASHFTQEFRARYGYTPRQLRENS